MRAGGEQVVRLGQANWRMDGDEEEEEKRDKREKKKKERNKPRKRQLEWCAPAQLSFRRREYSKWGPARQ